MSNGKTVSDDKTVLVDVRRPHAEPVPDGIHYLAVVDGPRKGQWIEVPAEPLVIGRSADADLVLDDRTVSGRHCRLRLEGEGLVVEDLGSMNGTYVGGMPARGPQQLPLGARLQVGSSVLKHEFRSRQEVQQQKLLTRELDKAAAYVRSLLPAPIDGEILSTDWRFVPCAQLGGDAFGYHWLDDDRFAIYLLDVCGHGPRSALHSVSVVNLLRKRTLRRVDFGRPVQVLRALNDAFQMEDHAGMYFTIWYGIFQASRRRLTFASAGHPPALLVDRGRGPQELCIERPGIGLFEETDYEEQEVEVPAASRLYLFSDGAFEVTTDEGREWTIEEFLDLLAAPASRRGGPERIERAVRQVANADYFEDDFSLLVTDFH